MILFAAIVVLAVIWKPAAATEKLSRIGVVATVSALITSYFWLPFLMERAYLNRIPYNRENTWAGSPLTGWHFASLRLIATDNLSVLNLMVLIGIGYAIYRRDRKSAAILVLALAWIGIYLTSIVSPDLRTILPMHEVLIPHRFSGAIDAALIFVIGLAGECIFDSLGWFGSLNRAVRLIVPTILLFALMIPALRERNVVYMANGHGIKLVKNRFEEDQDIRAVVKRLRELPPGRLFWRTRRLPEYSPAELIDYYDLVGLEPAQRLSLDSLFEDEFVPRDPVKCELFNVAYFVLPSEAQPPASLQLEPVMRNSRYSIWGIKTSGYAMLGSIAAAPELPRGILPSQRFIWEQNRNWIAGDDPAASRFLRWDYPERRKDRASPAESGSAPVSGAILSQQIASDRMEFSVDAKTPAALVIKITYHPQWRVTIDGVEAHTFMVSPSYLAVQIAPGAHRVIAEYESSAVKKVLMVIGLAGLIVACAWRRRIGIVAEKAADALLAVRGRLGGPVRTGHN